MKNWFFPTEENKYKPKLLNNAALSVYTLFLLAVNIFGNSFGSTRVYASSITTSNIISLTNQEREKYGLPKLTPNVALSTAAQMKANNMFEQQYWDHFGPNGETPWQFIKQTGYTYIYAGENLAKDFKTSEGVVQAWMASPTHRENILSGNYRDIGIAVVSGKLLGENTVLVVQMFGNLTKETVKSGTVDQTIKPSSENGKIKSISITYPEENSLVGARDLSIKGKVTNISGDYQVDITDNKKDIGSINTNGNTWQFDKRTDWAEGEHQVSASTKVDGEAYSDLVKFSVDSTAPKIIDNSISVEQKDNQYHVSILVDDLNATIFITSGDKSWEMKLEDDRFKVEIPRSEVGKKVVIILADKVGNTKDYDISEYFNVNGVGISNLVLSLSTIDTTGIVNKVFIGFILLLVLLEVIYSIRKGLLKKNGGSIMSVSIWIIILSVGIFNGFKGVINR